MLICLVGIVAFVLLTKFRPGREDVVEFGPDAAAGTVAADATPADAEAATVSADAPGEPPADDPGPTRATED